jgi:hypothetical protein
MSCIEQTKGRYVAKKSDGSFKRKSPPYPANECCGETKKGNDGKMYLSKKNKKGICKWTKSPKKQAKKKSPKKQAKKKSPKKQAKKKSPKKQKKEDREKELVKQIEELRKKLNEQRKNLARKDDNLLDILPERKNINKKVAPEEKKYAKDETDLNESQLKYCRCVLHILDGNVNYDKKHNREPHTCNKTRNWRKKYDREKKMAVEDPNGLKNCYLPYAVCAKVKKTSTGSKPCDYDFNKDIPKNELISYLLFNHAKYNEWRMKPYQKNNNKIPSADELSKLSEDKIRKYMSKWYHEKKDPDIKMYYDLEKNLKIANKKKITVKKDETKRKWAQKADIFQENLNKLIQKIKKK